MSIKGIGRLFALGLKKEATRGTAETSATHWLPFSDFGFDEKFENAPVDQAYGVIEDSIGMSRVKNWAEGTFKVPLTDQSIGLLFYSIFGGYAAAAHGAEGSVYDHTFTVGQSAQHQALTFFVHDPLAGVDYSHALGVVHKLDLEVALKKFAELTISAKALKGVSQSTFTPSLLTSENRFLPQYMAFNMAPTTSGMLKVQAATGTASSTANVTALSISTDLLSVGMTVVGTNIPAATTISAIVGAAALTLSQATTGVASDFTFGSLTATGTAASTTHVTACSINPQTKLQVGMTVYGTNIPAGAKVATIVSSTAFDLTAASTGAIGTMTFGPNVVQLKSLKLSIDEDIEDDEVLGSIAPVDYLNKQFKVEGSFECLWQNESDAKTFALVTPATPEAILIDLKNSDVTIGTAANPELAITLDRVYFTDFSRAVPINGLVKQMVKFRATYSATNSRMCKAVLTNTVSTY